MVVLLNSVINTTTKLIYILHNTLLLYHMLHLGLNKSNISKKKKDNSKLSKESKKTLLFNKSITQISLYIHLFTLKKIFKKNFLIFKNLQNYVKVRNVNKKKFTEYKFDKK